MLKQTYSKQRMLYSCYSISPTKFIRRETELWKPLTPRLSPIHRLPVELLAEIFWHCLPNYTHSFPNSFDRREAPLLLGRVSSHWRSVAYSTPILWASLSIIFLTKKLRHDASPIRAWIARSAGYPLTIAVDELFALPFEIQGVMDELVAVCHRWQHVTIHLRSYSIDSLVAIRGKLPLLRSLKLHLGAYESSARSARDIFEIAPQLHTVHVNFGLDGCRVKLPWAQLTEFSATHYPRLRSDECVAILIQCPNLVSCTFGRMYNGPHASPTHVDDRILHHLRSLHVYSTNCLAHFFECITLPALCTIRIDGSMGRTIGALISLLSRSSPVIVKAQFDILSPPDERDLIQCLEHMPSLIELGISRHKASFETDQLVRHLAPSLRDNALAPKLESIILRTGDLTFDNLYQHASLGETIC